MEARGSRRPMFEDGSFCLVLKVDVRRRMAHTSLYSVSACSRAFWNCVTTLRCPGCVLGAYGMLFFFPRIYIWMESKFCLAIETRSAILKLYQSLAVKLVLGACLPT